LKSSEAALARAKELHTIVNMAAGTNNAALWSEVQRLAHRVQLNATSVLRAAANESALAQSMESEQFLHEDEDEGMHTTGGKAKAGDDEIYTEENANARAGDNVKCWAVPEPLMLTHQTNHTTPLNEEQVASLMQALELSWQGDQRSVLMGTITINIEDTAQLVAEMGFQTMVLKCPRGTFEFKRDEERMSCSLMGAKLCYKTPLCSNLDGLCDQCNSHLPAAAAVAPADVGESMEQTAAVDDSMEQTAAGNDGTVRLTKD
jgi:hypothetical protein